jgi:hypothetical protein
MALYPRPAEHTLTVARTPVDGTCPACSGSTLATYPVHSEGGWFTTVRCQECLHETDRQPWKLHGWVDFLSDEIGKA